MLPSNSSSSKCSLTGQYALAAAAESFIRGSLEHSGRLSRLGGCWFQSVVPHAAFVKVSQYGRWC